MPPLDKFLWPLVTSNNTTWRRRQTLVAVLQQLINVLDSLEVIAHQQTELIGKAQVTIIVLHVLLTHAHAAVSHSLYNTAWTSLHNFYDSPDCRQIDRVEVLRPNRHKTRSFWRRTLCTWQWRLWLRLLLWLLLLLLHVFRLHLHDKFETAKTGIAAESNICCLHENCISGM